ncbi:MAG: hypothetical protein COA86_12970 [Kangiella sp.]|nr:MAG: hypothetical protein COA86_12970 [Kangiella sp.]
MSIESLDNKFDIEFEIGQNGDSAITLNFKNEIGETLTKNILLIKDSIADLINSAKLPDIIPAYQSLTLYYTEPLDDIEKIKNQISDIVKNTLLSITKSQQNKSKTSTKKIIRIPVCYEAPFAPDLNTLASFLAITTKELIEKHTNGNYLVHMLGFLPGFLYLGGLDESLHYPRKNTPAINIAKGSVGIGGQQTGIYPIESPGGWHIIGRTPLTLFDANKSKPTIAEPLDEIKFYAISSKEFIQLESQARN